MMDSSDIDFNANRHHQKMENAIQLSVDLELKKYHYIQNRDFNKQLNIFLKRQIQGDYESLDSAAKDGIDLLHSVKIFFDSGEMKKKTR